MTTATFLGLPVEVRLVIYDAYLMEHLQVKQNRQTTNGHLRILRTCRQINDEALPILSRYVSLSNEFEINAFTLNTSDAVAARVLWADVANDSRVIMPSKKGARPAPLSNLHLALRKMTSLQRLRVFECRRGLPISIQGPGAARLALEFELAMYPSGTAPPLSSYEVYVDAETRVQAFQVISPRSLVRLRLSGEVRLPPTMETPALRQITLHSITGNHLDRSHLEEPFSGAQFESFVYAQGHRLGLDLRNHHLESITALSRSRLRTLVLLGCSRVSSATIAMCLEQLPRLEVFALSFIGVDEPETDFLRYLPPSVFVLKLHISNTLYALPHLVGERSLCDTLEQSIMVRHRPPKLMALNLRQRLLDEGGRSDRFLEVAQLHGIQLRIGPWESELERAL